MEKATDILKIRYTVSPFDLETTSSHSRYVYELFPDGKVSYTHTKEVIEHHWQLQFPQRLLQKNIPGCAIT